jgi:hypothetical protein
MGKIKKRPASIRTVCADVGEKHSVSDEWPPRSHSGKYSLKSRVLTRVDAGEVYMEKYAPGRPPTTTVHRVRTAFVQGPNTVYAVGSVYGAKTVSFSMSPIDPTFIPQPDEEI